MTEEATLYDYWLALYQRKRAILMVTLLSAVFALVISLILPPVYEARSVFYVPVTASTPLYTVGGSSTQVDKAPLMPVPEEKSAGGHLGILKGERIATAVLKQFPHLTLRYLSNNADFVMNNYFMTEVYVRNEDPVEAAAIANYYPIAYREFHKQTISQRAEGNVQALERQIALTEQLLNENLNAQQRQRDRNLSASVTTGTLQMEITRLTDLLSSLRENLIESTLKAENPSVEVVLSENAIVPENPTFPRPILNTVVALVFGFVAGCYYALLLNYLSGIRQLKINRRMDITPLVEQARTETEST
ncbi:MAG: hypothetical protein HKN34_08995 [Gammaproteobacteria bacterium]|nr:hypothetical protein [Gammaproteobacteria bacterium]